MTTEHKPHSTRGYTDAQRQADGIRQLVGYIVNETPQNDDVDEYERKIDKWLDVWVEKHDSLEEQLEAMRDALYQIVGMKWLAGDEWDEVLKIANRGLRVSDPASEPEGN